MKRVSRTAVITSIILLVVDIVYIMNHLQTITIIHFLGLVVLLPCVLISIMITGLIAETHFREVKQQAVIAGILGAVVAIAAYIIAEHNQDYIENIVENSKKIKEFSNLSVSDININNGFSSYIFIFIIIFVLSTGFSILFNILYERRKRNVYE